MPHHLHIISAKFPWIFQNSKNICRKSEAVYKLIFSENKKDKIVTIITVIKKGKEEEIPAWLPVI